MATKQLQQHLKGTMSTSCSLPTKFGQNVINEGWTAGRPLPSPTPLPPSVLGAACALCVQNFSLFFPPYFSCFSQFFSPFPPPLLPPPPPPFYPSTPSLIILLHFFRFYCTSSIYWVKIVPNIFLLHINHRASQRYSIKSFPLNNMPGMKSTCRASIHPNSLVALVTTYSLYICN